MTKIGVIGKDGSDYIVAFTRNGIDLDTAGPEDFLFRSDVETIRPMTVGSVTIAHNADANVILPRSFTYFPLIFCQMDLGNGTMHAPYDGNIVEMARGASSFKIKNRSGSTRTFHYAVIDNEIGLRHLYATYEAAADNWMFFEE